jgi:hypothetical protein
MWPAAASTQSPKVSFPYMGHVGSLSQLAASGATGSLRRYFESLNVRGSNTARFLPSFRFLKSVIT